jgi:hypothetical protein
MSFMPRERSRVKVTHEYVSAEATEAPIKRTSAMTDPLITAYAYEDEVFINGLK